MQIQVCKTLYYPFLISANQCPYDNTRQNGGTTVIVNAGATPEDIHADFRFYDLNEFCQKLNHSSCISQSDV
jgi:hypothetical protein